MVPRRAFDNGTHEDDERSGIGPKVEGRERVSATLHLLNSIPTELVTMAGESARDRALKSSRLNLARALQIPTSI